MTVEWSLNAGNLFTVLLAFVGAIGSALALFYGTKAELRSLADKVALFGGRMINVENKLDKFGETLIELARVNERLTGLDRRIDQLQKSADEWRAWARPRIDGNGNSPR